MEKKGSMIVYYVNNKEVFRETNHRNMHGSLELAGSSGREIQRHQGELQPAAEPCPLGLPNLPGDGRVTARGKRRRFSPLLRQRRVILIVNSRRSGGARDSSRQADSPNGPSRYSREIVRLAKDPMGDPETGALET